MEVYKPPESCINIESKQVVSCYLERDSKIRDEITQQTSRITIDVSRFSNPEFSVAICQLFKGRATTQRTNHLRRNESDGCAHGNQPAI